MSALDAVIFDWGGTLTPWHTIDPHELWLGYSSVYDPEHADELARVLVSAELELWDRARHHQRSGTFEEMLRRSGVDPEGERHEAALRNYYAGWDPHTWTDPDVPDLLRGLRGLGLRIGVLSNTIWTREFHESVFLRDGVMDLIDGAVYSSEIPWTKPHPEAFLASVAAAGVEDPTRCVFVGDRPYDDIHGAKEVGMLAVLVPHSVIPADQQGRVEGHPDAVVDRLADLLDVVRGWIDA